MIREAAQYGDLFPRALELARERGKKSDVCEPFAEYATDPVRFGEEVLGRTYWEAQKVFLRALVEHGRVAWRAMHKCGKSFVLTDAGIWAMCTAPTTVIGVMPKAARLKEVMFANLRKAHAEARIQLPGQPFKMHWELGPKHIWEGIAANDPHAVAGHHADVDAPETEAGWHEYSEKDVEDLAARVKEIGKAGRVLILFDEAAGVPEFIYDGLRGTMAGDRVMVAQTCNPVMEANADHFVPRAFKEGSGWFRMKTAAYKAPDPVGSDAAFEEGYGPGDAFGVPPKLCPPSWVEEQKRELGEESPMFLGKVLGQFSTGLGSNQVIPYTLLANATGHVPEAALGRHIGVDLARYGGDKSVAVLTVDGLPRAIWGWEQCDAMESAAKIEQCMKSWAPEGEETVDPRCVHVDLGYEPGVVDRLRQKGYHVDGVDFGSGPIRDWPELCGSLAFQNRRAELHWNARRLLEEGLVGIPAGPEYAKLREEATWAKFKVREAGSGTVLTVLPKDDIRKEHGRSPDYWDAFLLSLCRPRQARVRFGRR